MSAQAGRGGRGAIRNAAIGQDEETQNGTPSSQEKIPRMTKRHYAHLVDSVVAAELQGKLPKFRTRNSRKAAASPRTGP